MEPYLKAWDNFGGGLNPETAGGLDSSVVIMPDGILVLEGEYYRMKEEFHQAYESGKRFSSYKEFLDYAGGYQGDTWTSYSAYCGY